MMQCAIVFFIFCTILLFILTESAIPQNCTSKDCTVHVIRVKLSQRPDAPEEEEVDYKLKPRKRYGSNVYEVTNKTISEEIARGIIKELPADTDPRLTDKLVKNEYYLKPVDSFDESLPKSHTLPPSPEARPQERPATVPSRHSSSSGFPLVFTALLLVAGVVLGVALTCIVLVMIDHANSPKFDRKDAVVYKRANDDILRRLENGTETGSRDSRSSSNRPVQVHHTKSRVPVPPARFSERRYIPHRDRERNSNSSRRDNHFSNQFAQQYQQLLVPPTPSPRTTISTPDNSQHRQTSL